MKANELMLNDYVLYKGKIARVLKLVAINIIDVSTGIGTNWRPHEDVNPNDVCPIPLTAEILEKNFPEPTDGITWYPEEGGFNCHTYVPDCEINAFGLFKYVHQLQHALRLCGIDKDIEL